MQTYCSWHHNWYEPRLEDGQDESLWCNTVYQILARARPHLFLSCPFCPWDPLLADTTVRSMNTLSPWWFFCSTSNIRKKIQTNCLVETYRKTLRKLLKKTIFIYLTKRTVSLQKDSSQLGPGTPSAHRGNRWWGRVTLRVKRNSRLEALTSVSSRITQDDVKSGMNLSSARWNIVSFLSPCTRYIKHTITCSFSNKFIKFKCRTTYLSKHQKKQAGI